MISLHIHLVTALLESPPLGSHLAHSEGDPSLVFNLLKVPRVPKFLLQGLASFSFLALKTEKLLECHLFRARDWAPPYLQGTGLVPYCLTWALCWTSKGQARVSHLDATPYLAVPRKTWNMYVSPSNFNLQLEA